MHLRRFVLGLTLLGLPLLGGCSLFSASEAAFRAIPLVARAMDGDDDEGPAARTVVPDRGHGWDRRLVSASGRPVATGEGERAAGIEWLVPVETTGGVRAVVGLRDAGCATTSPTSWALLSESGQPVGEAWRASAQQWNALDATAGHMTLGFYRAGEIERVLGLERGREVAYVLVLPADGRYDLAIRWLGAPGAATREQPCINAWIRIPLELALGVTAGEAVAYHESPTRTSQQSGGRVRGDAATGFSLPDPGGVSQHEGASRRAAAAATRFESPEYELVRLHQIALSYEIGGQAPGDGGIERHRESRLRHLEALVRKDEAGSIALCRLLDRHHLDEQAMALWGGEATVPVIVARRCRAR